MSTLIVPPFTEPEQAIRKVQLAEDLWNTRDPEGVASAYTEDTEWRNRTQFLTGRAAVIDFLKHKWAHGGRMSSITNSRRNSGDSATTAWQ
jgi:nuclear transport factor 2 (NTF2) superfamily protein